MFAKILKKFDSILAWLGHHLLFVSGFLVLLMAFAQTYGMVMRKIFNNPVSSAYELSTFFLLLCGILAFAGVEYLDQMVRNDIISSRFPPTFRKVVVEFLFPILGLIFLSILIWKSFDNALYSLQIGQVTQSSWALPLGPIKLTIPVCYILLGLVLIDKIIHTVIDLVRKKDA